MLRLGRIERGGQPGLDVAEGAGPRAGVAHDHEGGVFLFPAFADIRATGFLADRMQAVLAHDALGIAIARRDRRLDANPIRLGERGLVRPMRFFRMARPGGGNGIDDNGHNGSVSLK